MYFWVVEAELQGCTCPGNTHAGYIVLFRPVKPKECVIEFVWEFEGTLRSRRIA
jgi:hypothetical protein